MSRLNELIDKLCPNGVMYMEIGQITKILRGKRLTKSQLTSDKLYPVFHGGLEPLGYYGVSNRKANTVMIINVGASAGSVGYSSVDFWSSDGCYCLEHTEKVLSKYIYYYLLSCQNTLQSRVRYAGIPTLDAQVIEKVKIPIPPVEVQQEISDILDNFTRNIENIISKLTSEHIVRKKQYEYYKEELFKVNSDTRVVKLGNIADILRGGNFKKTDFTEVGIPCIHYGQIYTSYGLYACKALTNITEESAKKAKYATKNDIIMAVTSENIQDVCKAVAWLGEEDIAIGGHTAIIKHKQNAKYLSYYFSTAMFSKQKARLAQGTKVLDVAPNKLLNIQIPLPTLEEQERIVNILDRFNKLYTDISEGLLIEINARKKQYEFYRERLLTFKDLEK